MKIVINRCFGGFGVTEAVIKRMRELGSDEAKKQVLFGEYYPEWTDYSGKIHPPKLNNNELMRQHNSFSLKDRTSWQLLKALDEIGLKEGSGGLSKLAIVEIPDGIEWEISDYDGMETVEEKHRSWS